MKQRLLILLLIVSSFGFAQTETTVFSETNNSSGLAVHGNKLYIATAFSGAIYTLDLESTDAEPQLYMEIFGNISALCFQDDVLYFSLRSNIQADNKVFRVDTSVPDAEPEEIVSVPSPNGLAIDGNTLYISSGKKIFTVDLTQPTFMAVEFINSLDTIFGTVGMVIINDELFISDNDKLVKYNLAETTPDKFVVTEGLTNLTGLSKAEGDDYIYATSYGPNAVFKINLSTGEAINLASTSLATNWDIEFYDSMLFVSNLEGGQVVKIEGIVLEKQGFTQKLAAIYPVPADDRLSIENAEVVGMVDGTGKQFTISISESGLDVSGLPSGTYILTLKVNGNFIYKRFIKK